MQRFPARKNRAYHHGDLRRALLDATVKLVERDGFEAFTLRAAAKLAGVSDGAPYHHFADKEALLAAVAAEGFERLHQEMFAAARKQKGTAREKTQAMGVAYVLFAAKHSSYFRIMFNGTLNRPDKYPELARAASRAFRLVDGMLTETSSRDAQRTRRKPMYGTRAIVHGLSFLSIDGFLGVNSRNDRSLARLVWNVIRSADSAATGRRGSRRVA